MNEVELFVGGVQTLVGVVLAQIVSEKRSQRSERFLRRIARTDDERDALTLRTASSEGFEALLTAAVFSASAADAEHRISALAAIVRRGLESDDATISSVLRAEGAVHDLDAIELRLLLVIGDGPRAEVPSPNDSSATVIGGLDITDLRHAIAGPKGIHESLAARLVARGLIEDCALGSLGYKPRWAITEFGLEVLVFLQSHED